MIYAASPLVIAQPTQEGVCLLHTTQGQCHLLNRVAAFVWERLEELQNGSNAEALADQVTAQWDISYEQALADVSAFLAQALEAGLVSGR